MKLYVMLVALICSTMAWAEGPKAFYCQRTIEDQKMLFVVEKVDETYWGQLDWGRGPQGEEVEYTNLTRAQAKQNSFVLQMANGVLKLNWRKISRVEIFRWGNFYDAAAGALGFNFLDRHGDVFAKGMYFGWAGPLSCKP